MYQLLCSPCRLYGHYSAHPSGHISQGNEWDKHRHFYQYVYLFHMFLKAYNQYMDPQGQDNVFAQQCNELDS